MDKSESKITEKIILAALEEIKVHSLKFTMSELTRRMRMSKTSLYKMVYSKDMLIEAIVSYIIDDFNRQEKIILNSDMDTHNKIISIIQLYTKIFDSMSVNLYTDLQIMYPNEWERWCAFHEEKIAKMIELLQQGIDEGIYRNVDLNIICQCLTASIYGVSDTTFLRKHGLNYGVAINAIVDILFDGIKVK